MSTPAPKPTTIPNKTTLVLIVDEIERVIGPNLLDLLDVLFKGHLGGSINIV
jgi:hypothetical protein